MAPLDRCFVSMPFGRKALPWGEVIDFDRLYLGSISPAVRAAGLIPVRADDLVTTGVVTRAVIEAIARSDVMIADVSTRDPNVYYELGLRDVLAPRTTLILNAQGTQPAFDILSRRLLYYNLADGITDASLNRLRDQLLETLRDQLESKTVDSPFFQLFPVEPLLLPDDPPGARHRRKRVEAFRARLLEARRAFPEEGMALLKELEQDFADAGIEDERLLTDLMLAYRDFAAWDDVVRLISAFPPRLRDSPVVVQQNALALSRRGSLGDDDQAEALLQRLMDRFGPDAETYGLLGRIYKARYLRSGDRGDLYAAIQAYRSGWLTDPEDIYPGMNLVTLLTLAGDPAAEEEVRQVVSSLRRSVERRIESGPADYWDIATALELAAIGRDWDAAKELVAPARARAASPWMLASTLDNLRMLASAMNDPRDHSQMERLIHELGLEVLDR